MARGRDVGATCAAHRWLKKARTAAAEHFHGLDRVKVPCGGGVDGGDGQAFRPAEAAAHSAPTQGPGRLRRAPIIAHRTPSSPDGP